MRLWNGLKINATVYYNNEIDKEYRVLQLYEKDNKKMCRIQSVKDKHIIIETTIQSCKKAI